MINGRIVKNFTLQEMMNTQAKDEPKLVLSEKVVLQAQMMQDLRDWSVAAYPSIFGKSGLSVSSWYRTPAFNKSVKGSVDSQHLDGTATDINNIPASLYDEFTTAWQVICSKYNCIGGVNYYKWGMHFGSYEDKFGNTKFVVRDKR